MFKNLLIADSGKGHVEEMIRMLQDIPSFREAKVNLLHVVPEQNTAQAADHRNDGQAEESQVQREALEIWEATPFALRSPLPLCLPRARRARPVPRSRTCSSATWSSRRGRSTA